jgi:hypothetical protein
MSLQKVLVDIENKRSEFLRMHFVIQLDHDQSQWQSLLLVRKPYSYSTVTTSDLIADGFAAILWPTMFVPECEKGDIQAERARAWTKSYSNNGVASLPLASGRVGVFVGR